MNTSLVLTLINPKRIPAYLDAVFYAMRHNILSYKWSFPGMLSLPEGIALHRMAKKLPQGAVMVEIGCYGGLSTSFLLSGSDKSVMLYAIDPFARGVSEQRKRIKKGSDKDYAKEEVNILIKKPTKQQVAQALGVKGLTHVTLLEGYSHILVKKWKKKIDLLWIDGDHDYEAVKKDFLEWVPFVKKGGYVLLHDANKKDTSKRWNNGWLGPTRVVAEYIHAPKWKEIQRVDSLVVAQKNY